MNQYRQAYIAIEAMITVIIIATTITWYLTNQGQMTQQIKQQEQKLHQLRIEKERSDEKLQAALQSPTSLHPN
ncbi:hypothetical protein [Periweissella ghanensis]|uniref:Uncharacterized protein n=1 Tax=Periweissella ghanensis TaxID=467997 RepID=A0ABM8ZBC8_9LACO|nr:hypothetical protein [Periweissella ghanensis]MCM0600636.1 hypothetical protein [Periweissella ghanensis]CAH0418474.1 hypothetical protein WGH24286_00892 [Periweissella ghanensis]